MSKNLLNDKIKRGKLFGVVGCSLEVTEEMYPYFKDFPPIFKNCEVRRDDIGEHMKEFAERNKLLRRHRKMLISSFKLERRPVITPILLFYLENGVVLKDVFWFLQYIPRRCFESFVKNVSDSRREGDQKKELTRTKIPYFSHRISVEELPTFFRKQNPVGAWFSRWIIFDYIKRVCRELSWSKISREGTEISVF